jgi:hypothetical protein
MKLAAVLTLTLPLTFVTHTVLAFGRPSRIGASQIAQAQDRARNQEQARGVAQRPFGSPGPVRPPRIGASQPPPSGRSTQVPIQQRPIRSPFQPGQGDAPVDIQVEVTRMQGLGCPTGGASATLSPDGSSISILFDKMSTELAAGSPSIEKKTCLVYLGLKFEGPYRVAIVGSDARGFVSVPQGAQSTISIQHYSIFTMDPRILRRMNLTQTFVGPAAEDVVLHSEFRDVPMWSYCGSQMRGRQSMPLMTIGLSIESSNSNPSENLIAAIDSLDIGGTPTLTYDLLWTQDTRNCPP